jgi:hypothetical protein
MIESLIEAAEQEATRIRTITRADGSTYQGARNYGSADDGAVQVYVVPVDRRISVRAPHYRATFYLKQGESWKRTSRACAEAAMAERSSLIGGER